MQKKKIGSIIDAERALYASRLAELDRLYETATSVDAESDLRMMTHSVQLRMQQVERRQRILTAKAQAQHAEVESDGGLGSLAGSFSFVGRRLADAAGSGSFMNGIHELFQFDGGWLTDPLQQHQYEFMPV